MLRSFEVAPYSHEILFRIDGRGRRFDRVRDYDPKPKPQRAQLLELLRVFERARWRRTDGLQAAGAIRVQADVAAHHRHAAIARPRDRRATEVQRPTVLVRHDLREV